MELLPNISDNEEEKEELPNNTEEVIENKEEIKEQPFIEIEIPEKKPRKKKKKKIIENIIEDNLPLIEPNDNKQYHIDEQEKTRNLIKETIKNELYEVKQIKKPKTKKPLSEKQKAHIERMRLKAKQNRDDKERIKKLEEQLKLKNDIDTEKIDTYIKNKIKEQKISTPPPPSPKPKPEPKPEPVKFITSNLNPRYSRIQRQRKQQKEINYDDLFNY